MADSYTTYSDEDRKKIDEMRKSLPPRTPDALAVAKAKFDSQTTLDEAQFNAINAAKFWHAKKGATPVSQLSLEEIGLYDAINHLYRIELRHDK